MGSKVSKPSRKLAAAAALQPLAPVSRAKVQLPSGELRARAAAPPEAPTTKPHPSDKLTNAPDPSSINPFPRDSQVSAPEGKDGMDPQADQKYLDLITNLGRQIHTKTVGQPGQQADVIALKQLLNRKRLHAAGQSEEKAQLNSPGSQRTVINPKTLTAIIDAMNDPHSTHADVERDFLLGTGFLAGLSRFKVAHNVVMIEEHADEDQIGPIKGRRHTQKEQLETEEEDPQMKELKRRLE